MILALAAMTMAALIVIIPKLLRVHLRNQELRNAERMKAIEQGIPIPPVDERAKAAGRIAVVVPCVGVIAAGTVTGFLSVYKSDSFLAVSIAVWLVAGIVSLAAITGSIALVGRLAQIESGDDDEKPQITR